MTWICSLYAAFKMLPCLVCLLLHALCNADLCQEAGSSCNGGQSVINPWVIVGGVATAVCGPKDFIMLVSSQSIIVTHSLS